MMPSMISSASVRSYNMKLSFKGSSLGSARASARTAVLGHILKPSRSSHFLAASIDNFVVLRTNHERISSCLANVRRSLAPSSSLSDMERVSCVRVAGLERNPFLHGSLPPDLAITATLHPQDLHHEDHLVVWHHSCCLSACLLKKKIRSLFSNLKSGQPNLN